MLTARKNTLFEKIFAVYNKNLIGRRFYYLRVKNLVELQHRSSRVPLLIYANHSSWWDGLVAFEISRACGLDAFVMMEERQLKKLFLFRRLGAFSVVRENPRKAVESLRYAANLLNESPKRVVWIFPQGEILPQDARPIFFYNGLSRIVEKVGRVEVLPVAMRYEFTGEFKPEIFVKIGRIETINVTADFDSKKATVGFAEKLTELLDDLKTDVSESSVGDYERLI